MSKRASKPEPSPQVATYAIDMCHSVVANYIDNLVQAGVPRDNAAAAAGWIALLEAAHAAWHGAGYTKAAFMDAAAKAYDQAQGAPTEPALCHSRHGELNS
jgi:hypothetical protein